jgi:hypothetical protein
LSSITNKTVSAEAAEALEEGHIPRSLKKKLLNRGSWVKNTDMSIILAVLGWVGQGRGSKSLTKFFSESTMLAVLKLVWGGQLSLGGRSRKSHYIA